MKLTYGGDAVLFIRWIKVTLPLGKESSPNFASNVKWI